MAITCATQRTQDRRKWLQIMEEDSAALLTVRGY